MGCGHVYLGDEVHPTAASLPSHPCPALPWCPCHQGPPLLQPKLPHGSQQEPHPHIRRWSLAVVTSATPSLRRQSLAAVTGLSQELRSPGAGAMGVGSPRRLPTKPVPVLPGVHREPSGHPEPPLPGRVMPAVHGGQQPLHLRGQGLPSAGLEPLQVAPWPWWLLVQL